MNNEFGHSGSVACLQSCRQGRCGCRKQTLPHGSERPARHLRLVDGTHCQLWRLWSWILWSGSFGAEPGTRAPNNRICHIRHCVPAYFVQKFAWATLGLFQRILSKSLLGPHWGCQFHDALPMPYRCLTDALPMPYAMPYRFFHVFARILRG